MKSIAIIIPYFGKFPTMFPFWLHSALNNGTIDFLIFTDQYNFCTEKNINVVHMSFGQLKDMVQSHFDFPISLEKAYKLCDYRGAYGEIFRDYLEKYDFWGFGDIDLVYGDIRNFITNDILEKYDVISGWGHLTLYRNNDFCNSFYKRKDNGFLYYEDVFSDDKNFYFDEYWHKGLSDKWKSLYPEKIWDSRLFDDIRIPEINMNFVSVFHPEYSDCLIFLYENSKLFRIYLIDGKIKKEETLYAHFQKRKFMKIKTDNYNNYLIVPNKFISASGMFLNVRRMQWYGRPQELKRKIFNKKNRLLYKLDKYLKIHF